jgi:hypothetical protein
MSLTPDTSWRRAIVLEPWHRQWHRPVSQAPGRLDASDTTSLHNRRELLVDVAPGSQATDAVDFHLGGLSQLQIHGGDGPVSTPIP